MCIPKQGSLSFCLPSLALARSRARALPLSVSVSVSISAIVSFAVPVSISLYLSISLDLARSLASIDKITAAFALRSALHASSQTCADTGKDGKLAAMNVAVEREIKSRLERVTPV